MKNRKLYYFALIPCLIGIVLGSFFDYTINNAIYSPNNGFGIFMSAFAPILGYAILAILCGLFHRAAIKEETMWLKIVFFLLSIGGMIPTILISAGHVTSVNAYNCPEYKWLWIIIEIVIYCGFFVLGDFFGKSNTSKPILWASLVFAGLVIIDLVPVGQIIKNLVRRPRFRICVDNSYGIQVSFINWWEPGNELYNSLVPTYESIIPSFSEHFKSFPSGHTGVAAILIFGLPFLSNIVPKLKDKENLLFAIGMAYTVLMGFSRMLIGAHYLSDVSFGALINIICMIIANEINLKFFLKEENVVD